MRRLLVIEVETDLCGTIRGKIQRQTHRNSDFTDAGDHFMASNGFILKSANSPAINPPMCLFVRGTSTVSNSVSFAIPYNNGYMENLKPAVREYNQKFSDGAEYELLA